MKKISIISPLIAAVFITGVFVFGIKLHQQAQNSLGSPIIGRVGQADIYPPASVPGAINPNVTQENISSTICKANWTAGIRPPTSYTNKLKIQQLAQFPYIKKNAQGYLEQINANPKDYEEDHFISLQLGGNPTSELNLWPEKYPTARLKDQVENYLKREICSGKMTLKEAQRAITEDWYRVYRENLGGKISVSLNDSDDE